jgi:type II secretory pathway pseudopilin PulG
MRFRRGWVFIDVVMAMILVSIIAAILGAAADWHQRALRHLTNSRAATRLAESAILSMQSGQTPSNRGEAGLTFHKLSASSDIPGKIWVEVEATVGIVPQNALPGGGS